MASTSKATPELIRQAVAAGAAAAQRGSYRVPGRCQTCAEIVRGWLPGHGAEEIYMAWLRAYDLTNLQQAAAAA